MRRVWLSSAASFIVAAFLGACADSAPLTAPELTIQRSTCVVGVQLSPLNPHVGNPSVFNPSSPSSPPSSGPIGPISSSLCGCGGVQLNAMGEAANSSSSCADYCEMTNYTGYGCNGDECRNGGWIGNLSCDPHDCRNRIGHFDYGDCEDEDGGGGPIAPPDSVSYEMMVAATQELTAAMDEMVEIWSGDILAASSSSVGTPSPSSSGSSVVLPWETLIDIFVLVKDTHELIVAGPTAANVAVVTADLAAVFTPYVPAPGTVRILVNGAKASKAQFDRTKNLAAAAREGVVKHTAFSNTQRAAGQIGAKRIVQIKDGAQRIGYIDGANIFKNGDTWIFEIIELKPRNDAAEALGRTQLARYEAGLKTMTSFTHNGVVHNLTDPRWTFVRKLETYSP